MAFKWIWRELKGYRLRMLLGFALVLLFSFLSTVSPRISGTIVDQVIGAGKMDLLPALLVQLFIVVVVRALVKMLNQLIFESTSQTVTFNIREKLYKKLQELDFSYFDRTRTGDIMAKMTGDTDLARYFVGFVAGSCVENITTFILALVFLFSIDAKLAAAMVAMTPLICILTVKFAGKVRPTHSDIREQFSRLNSVCQENISGNRVVKAFAKEGYEIEKFNLENNEYRRKNLISTKLWTRFVPAINSVAGLLSVIMIIFGGYLVIKGEMTLGNLVTFNGFIWMLNGPMSMAGWLINDIQRFAASGDKVLEILNAKSKITNPENPKSAEKGNKFKGLVEFKNVSFKYDTEEVLKDINFKVEPGQVVGIVGPTGSGKTSLINLLARFYDVTDGSITIDGINVKDINLQNLRANIAIAMQDIFLFSDTIEGNIAYAVPSIPFEEVQKSASAAVADEFIKGMEDGYDTIVGERGVGLSGGQKQRIALARAIIKNSPILVLDDTTSAVDLETEHEIQKNLKEVDANATRFIIAHRISSVQKADLILVLNEGKIVERGTHDELLSQKGYYYQVFMSQYSEYEEIASYMQKEVG